MHYIYFGVHAHACIVFMYAYLCVRVFGRTHASIKGTYLSHAYARKYMPMSSHTYRYFFFENACTVHLKLCIYSCYVQLYLCIHSFEVITEERVWLQSLVWVCGCP
jgi:hypothetical protein